MAWKAVFVYAHSIDLMYADSRNITNAFRNCSREVIKKRDKNRLSGASLKNLLNDVDDLVLDIMDKGATYQYLDVSDTEVDDGMQGIVKNKSHGMCAPMMINSDGESFFEQWNGISVSPVSSCGSGSEVFKKTVTESREYVSPSVSLSILDNNSDVQAPAEFETSFHSTVAYENQSCQVQGGIAATVDDPLQVALNEERNEDRSINDIIQEASNMRREKKICNAKAKCRLSEDAALHAVNKRMYLAQEKCFLELAKDYSILNSKSA